VRPGEPVIALIAVICAIIVITAVLLLAIAGQF